MLTCPKLHYVAHDSFVVRARVRSDMGDEIREMPSMITQELESECLLVRAIIKRKGRKPIGSLPRTRQHADDLGNAIGDTLHQLHTRIPALQYPYTMTASNFLNSL